MKSDYYFTKKFSLLGLQYGDKIKEDNIPTNVAL